MTATTSEEILESLEYYQSKMFPKQKSMDILTGHYLLNSSIADAMHDVYVRIEEVLDKVDIMRAVGTDLDYLVADRLLDGRQLGDYATGYLTFYRNSPATTPITIPIDVVCYLINSRGTQTQFKTTSVGSIGIGEKTCSVSAIAVERGVGGNVSLGTIVHIQTPVIAGVATPLSVDGVNNPLPFSGGTLDETDAELRQRYIDVVSLPGLATVEMIERHLVDLENIKEARVISWGLGDIEIIVDYSEGIDEINDDIVDEMKSTIAAGVQARGCHAAVVASGSPGTVISVLDPLTLDAADCQGGLVWFRPTEHVQSADTIVSFNYINMAGLTQVGSALIPAGTYRGTMVQATLADDDERAVSIPDGAITCTFDYDILIGMGEPGYLYILPTPVSMTFNVGIVLKEDPEIDLLSNIATSIENWMQDYVIGEKVEWSDIRTCCTIAYERATLPDQKHVLQGTERPFIGIDSLFGISVSGGGESINADGQSIILEHDEIARFNSISFTT